MSAVQRGRTGSAKDAAKTQQRDMNRTVEGSSRQTCKGHGRDTAAVCKMAMDGRPQRSWSMLGSRCQDHRSDGLGGAAPCQAIQQPTYHCINLSQHLSRTDSGPSSRRGQPELSRHDLAAEPWGMKQPTFCLLRYLKTHRQRPTV